MRIKYILAKGKMPVTASTQRTMQVIVLPSKADNVSYRASWQKE